MQRPILIKVSIRIVLLAAIILSINYVYKSFFLEKDIQQHSEVINKVRDVPLDADILYIGESSNVTFRSDDIDKRPISAFIADHFPELKLADITKPASHAGIYKVLLENIPENSNIQTLIVTLNLRSFDAQWIYSNLETSLQKSMVLIKDNPPILNRFLLSFKAYDIKTDAEREKQFKRQWKKDEFDLPFDFQHKNVKEWDAYMWDKGIVNADGSKNKELTELACHYIKTYGFQIDTMHNPRIKDFDDIVKLAKHRNWNLVFNLLAENTDKAEQLVGEELIYMMEENTELLKEYYKLKGVQVVDNLNEVENDQFIDQNWTTEHYAEQGRKLIAKNVATSLQNFHPNEYLEVDYKNEIQTSFFHNCDDPLVWGQIQTISEDVSFSGKKSSKTGEGNDFSITFEYPMKLIPDSLKNQILIGFKVFQNANDHDAKLAIQADGQSFDHFWTSYAINEQIELIKSWQDFDLTFTIPDSIKQADLIKIYVYNPSDKLVYIDDLSIIFE